jgi:hypothetical protein
MLLAVLFLVDIARAQGRVTVRPDGSRVTTLPYSMPDNAGNQWIIYQQGWLRQQGAMQTFSQAAQLTVNGQGLNSQNNQGRIDDKTGELILENLTAGQIPVTRRIAVNRTDGYVRYVDIFKNPGNQEAVLHLQYTANFNFAMQSAQPITDAKNKNASIGVASMLQAGRAVFELFAGKGSKLSPTVNATPNNNVIQAVIRLTVPANGEAAVFHIHGAAKSQQDAVTFATSMKEMQALSDLPIEIRRLVANLQPAQSVGDRELLRVDLFDVIELNGGDQLRGKIIDKTFRLQSLYGPIELSAEKVAGILNIGQVRPRQLIVTIDGEVFGGTLASPAIGIQLSSGQTTQVPLGQFSRAGFRKRDNEPEEWTFASPMILLRSHDRMFIQLPATPVQVMTRYGALQLDPKTVASIIFEPESKGLHEVNLIDGSSFSALVPAEQFELQLTGASQAKVVFSTPMIQKLSFVPGVEIDADSPRLKLSSGDELVGTLAGTLELQTLFDKITVSGAEIQSIASPADGSLDVQIVLWDQTSLSGQLRETTLALQLKSGISVSVPVPLIREYQNSRPTPGDSMVKQIRAIVANLSNDDWKSRERAEADLVSMGPAVVSVLKPMMASLPPEAQQRIESIIRRLDQPKATNAPQPFIDE